MQRAPEGHRLLPELAAGTHGAVFQVGDGGLIHGTQAHPGTHLDRHVAQRHAAFHGELLHVGASVFHSSARTGGRAQAPDDPQDHILGTQRSMGGAMQHDAHVLRLARHQALGGQAMGHLGGADAEGQRAKGAVGGGMGVATDDGDARQREALLRTHHMHDTLTSIAHGQLDDAETPGVAPQGRQLFLRQGVCHLETCGGDVVIFHGKLCGTATHRAPGMLQRGKGLRRGHLVQQLAVDVQKRAAVRQLIHHMTGPELVVECHCRHGLLLHFSGIRTTGHEPDDPLPRQSIMNPPPRLQRRDPASCRQQIPCPHGAYDRRFARDGANDDP